MDVATVLLLGVLLDLLDKFKSLIKEKISPVIVYIMLAVCILGIGGCIYLIYTLPAKIWGG